MKQWIETYLKTHLFYIILILVGVIAFKSWEAEHDQRMADEKQIALDQQTVKSLQQQITDTQAAAAKAVASVKSVVTAAKTPTQQLAAVPQLEEFQLNSRPISSLPGQPPAVAVDLAPLVQELGKAKEDAIDLQACQDESADKDKIIVADNDQIKVLKAKPKFWARIKSHGKWAVVGMLVYEGVRIYLTKKP